MAFAFVRFLVALLALIGVCVYTMRFLPLDSRAMGMWVALLVVLPLVSYTWSSFARKCYSPEVREKTPFLYAVGMLFGVPQKVMGIIFTLIGLVWIYSYMSGSVILSIATIFFSFGLLIFGLSWLINTGLHALKNKKP